jgi:hypothetical protein
LEVVNHQEECEWSGREGDNGRGLVTKWRILFEYDILQIGRVRWMFLQAVLRQDMSWYDTNKTANFASRITE